MTMLKNLRFVAIGLALFAIPSAAIAEDTASRPTPALSIGSDVDQLEVIPLPCSKQSFQLQFTNTSSEAVYADAFLTAPAPLKVSRQVVTSYLPAGYQLKLPITVTAPAGTTPGQYIVDLRAGNDRHSITVSVVEPPANPSGNLAVSAVVTASTENLPTYPACGAADGDRDSAHWASTTGWNDATKGTYPDWLRLDLAAPATVGKVDLYTLDSTRYPAAAYGLRDWDVQVLSSSGQWQTVASVRGNTAGMVSSTFPPVSTSAVRILTLEDNEPGLTYSRIVEVEIFAG